MLDFNVVLEEIPVSITGADKIKRILMLRELNGSQREIYDSNFKFNVEMDGDEAKAVVSDDFKPFPAVDFVAMCLHTEDGKLVEKDIIEAYPARVIKGLHEAALKLSGMDTDSVEAAKND